MSLTGWPFGPTGKTGPQAAPLRAGPLLPTCWHAVVLPPLDSSPIPAATTIATIAPMTQPRTVRNFVHSACSNSANPSRPACRSDW